MYCVGVLLSDGPRSESAGADSGRDAADIVSELAYRVFLSECSDKRYGEACPKLFGNLALGQLVGILVQVVGSFLVIQ